jgi:hypothetical protein
MRILRSCTLALALVQLAGACSTIGHEKVQGWPPLQIVEHRVPHAEMRSRCSPYMAPGMLPEACAEFDFAAGECHTWFSADFPPPRAVVEHEKLHCLGYDHPGESTMRRLLQRHIAAAALPL